MDGKFPSTRTKGMRKAGREEGRRKEGQQDEKRGRKKNGVTTFHLDQKKK